MNPNGQSVLKKHHPFYSTSKEFLQKGKVEKNKTVYPVAKCWILFDWNPGWGCQMIPSFFFWFVQKTDIQSWWVGVRFPPKKKYGLIFPFFPKVFEEIKLLGYFWVLLQQSLWVLQIWWISHPENHQALNPAPWCTSRMILFWSCWHGRCGSC